MVKSWWATEVVEQILMNEKNVKLWKSKFIKNDMNYNDAKIDKIMDCDYKYKEIEKSFKSMLFSFLVFS